jgi:hypothetical protein
MKQQRRNLRVKKARGAGTPVANLHMFCDFSCPYAEFAPPQAVGACRREQAVYCAFYREFNSKHSFCLARKRGGRYLTDMNTPHPRP